jgi:hypothetical protein
MQFCVFDPVTDIPRQVDREQSHSLASIKRGTPCVNVSAHNITMKALIYLNCCSNWLIIYLILVVEKLYIEKLYWLYIV